MEEPYVERSYLNLDSDTEASLYTRNSRLRHSHWDESPPGSSRKVRAVLGGFAGNGLGTRFKEGISNLSRVKLYTLIAIIVIIVLGGVGGGVAAGIVTKRNNSTTNLR